MTRWLSASTWAQTEELRPNMYVVGSKEDGPGSVNATAAVGRHSAFGFWLMRAADQRRTAPRCLRFLGV